MTTSEDSCAWMCSVSPVISRIVKHITFSIKNEKSAGDCAYWTSLLKLFRSANSVEYCRVFDAFGGVSMLKDVLSVDLKRFKYALKASTEILLLLTKTNTAMRDTIYSSGFTTLLCNHIELFRFSTFHLLAVKLFLELAVASESHLEGNEQKEKSKINTDCDSILASAALESNTESIDNLLINYANRRRSTKIKFQDTVRFRSLPHDLPQGLSEIEDSISDTDTDASDANDPTMNLTMKINEFERISEKKSDDNHSSILPGHHDDKQQRNSDDNNERHSDDKHHEHHRVTSSLIDLLKSPHRRCYRTALLLGISLWQDEAAVRHMFSTAKEGDKAIRFFASAIMAQLCRLIVMESDPLVQYEAAEFVSLLYCSLTSPDTVLSEIFSVILLKCPMEMFSDINGTEYSDLPPYRNIDNAEYNKHAQFSQQYSDNSSNKTVYKSTPGNRNDPKGNDPKRNNMGDNRGVNGFWGRTRRDQGAILRLKYENSPLLPECGELIPSSKLHDSASQGRGEGDGADGGPEGEYSWVGNDPVIVSCFMARRILDIIGEKISKIRADENGSDSVPELGCEEQRLHGLMRGLCDLFPFFLFIDVIYTDSIMNEEQSPVENDYLRNKERKKLRNEQRNEQNKEEAEKYDDRNQRRDDAEKIKRIETQRALGVLTPFLTHWMHADSDTVRSLRTVLTHCTHDASEATTRIIITNFESIIASICEEGRYEGGRDNIDPLNAYREVSGQSKPSALSSLSSQPNHTYSRSRGQHDTHQARLMMRKIIIYLGNKIKEYSTKHSAEHSMENSLKTGDKQKKDVECSLFSRLKTVLSTQLPLLRGKNEKYVSIEDEIMKVKGEKNNQKMYISVNKVQESLIADDEKNIEENLLNKLKSDIILFDYKASLEEILRKNEEEKMEILMKKEEKMLKKNEKAIIADLVSQSSSQIDPDDTSDLTELSNVIRDPRDLGPNSGMKRKENKDHVRVVKPEVNSNKNKIYLKMQKIRLKREREQKKDEEFRIKEAINKAMMRKSSALHPYFVQSEGYRIEDKNGLLLSNIQDSSNMKRHSTDMKDGSSSSPLEIIEEKKNIKLNGKDGISVVLWESIWDRKKEENRNCHNENNAYSRNNNNNNNRNNCDYGTDYNCIQRKEHIKNPYFQPNFTLTDPLIITEKGGKEMRRKQGEKNFSAVLSLSFAPTKPEGSVPSIRRHLIGPKQ